MSLLQEITGDKKKRALPPPPTAASPPPKEANAPGKRKKEKNDIFVIDEKQTDLLIGTNEPEEAHFKEGEGSESGVLTEEQLEQKLKFADVGTLDMTLMETASSTSSMSGPVPVLLEEKESKETFANKMEYIMTLVSYAIGFGTMWRFPYLMQEYGGIVFLIPYVFMLIFLGIPLFLLELAIGQRIRKSSIKCWNQVSHFLAGIGIAAALSCVLIGFYENTLIAWCFLYLISGVQNPLPWSSCEVAEAECKKPGGDKDKCSSCEMAGSSSYFWYRDILGISDGITDPGGINWAMFGCLMFSWVLIWAILVRGMAVAGKVAYLTSLLPYFVMLIFLVRGLFEDGMEYGFAVVFTPRWEVLYDIKVWFIAGTQILFTQGLAVGILVSYAALQAANNNCIKDALTVPLIDFFTSILACVVNCPILGSKGLATFNVCKRDAYAALNQTTTANMSTSTNGSTSATWGLTSNAAHVIKNWHFPGNNTDRKEKICDVYESVKMSASGTGLIFITFTTAIQQFPAPQFWAVLFFVMLLTVGVGSSFPQIEGFVLCLQDVDFFHIGRFAKWKITTGVCLILVACSTVFAWGWGQYVLSFLDEFAANWSLLIISFCECIGIAWVYGLKKFSYDLHLMTGKSPNNWFIQCVMVCLKFFAPLVMITLQLFQLYQYGVDEDKLSYLTWNHTLGRAVKRIWPAHVTALGFLLTAIVVGCIIVFAILAAFKIHPLREEKRSKFPERRLRRDRNIPAYEYDEDQDTHRTRWEKILYWKIGDLKRRLPPLLQEPIPGPSLKSA